VPPVGSDGSARWPSQTAYSAHSAHWGNPDCDFLFRSLRRLDRFSFVCPLNHPAELVSRAEDTARRGAGLCGRTVGRSLWLEAVAKTHRATVRLGPGLLGRR